MNKLNTAALGGMELHLDDFEFLHGANKEALSSIASILGWNIRTFTPSVVSLVISWGDGYLLTEDEIFLVDSGSIPVVVGQTAYMALVQTFLPAGSELNKAGSPIETYIRRQATIKYSANPVAEADYLVLLSSTNRLAQSPRYLVDSWTEIPLVAQYSANPHVRARKEGTGIVRLSGRINKVSGGNVDISATPLPTDMRPAYDMRFSCFALWPLPVYLTIKTNGLILLSIETNVDFDDPTGLLINLDGITFNV